MNKFTIRHYHKSNALMMVNGGRLIVTENEYIIKYLFLTVARYRMKETVASRISSISKGINLNDGEKEIDIYFFSQTADKVYRLLKV